VWTRSTSSARALLGVSAELRSSAGKSGEAELRFTVLDPAGAEVLSTVRPAKLEAGALRHLATELPLPSPLLWSPDRPSLYTLRSELRVDGSLRDREELRFGIRTLAWSAEQGFLLNGEPVLLRGGNVHHDHGPLGAAAFPDAEERKVRLLLEAGYNAVRTAHNPPSTAFLEACDRLGMLVFDEAFDGWKASKTRHDYGETFDGNWEADLRAFVRRDRNHPCVIAWSLGNEVYERGNAGGVRIAHQLAAAVRSLDRTRPVTVGLNGLGETADWSRLDPIFDALDLAGYNYEIGRRHADDHRRRPNRIVYASESYQLEAFENWQLVQAHPHVIGDFVWSAIDYLGEAGIGRVFASGETVRPHWEGSHYPWFGASCGDLTLTGRRKPVSHYRQLVWNRGVTLHASVRVPAPDGKPWQLSQWSVPPAIESWTWPGQEGKALTLVVASHHPRARVSLNGRTVAEQDIGPEYRSTFDVPYQPGELVVEGLDAGGRPAERRVLATAGEPSSLRLELVEPMESGDSLDLAYVDLTVRDDAGRWCPGAALPLACRVDGPAEILALGNDRLMEAGPAFSSPRRDTFEGRAQIILRGTGASGKVTLEVESVGLPSATLEIGVPAERE